MQAPYATSAMEAFLERLNQTTRYYTGYPRVKRQSYVYDFTSEREFVQLVQEGDPVVVAFTLKCEHTKHLDQTLKDVSSEYHPHVRVLRVECPKYPGFCISRQRSDYPFVEVFLSSRQVDRVEGSEGAGITRYSVQVLPYNNDISLYGFREFFKKTGLA